MSRMRVVFIASLLIAVPSASGAQELASSFDQLRVLVKAGDRLTVTDATGQELRGRLAALSASRLEIVAPAGNRAFQESEVRTIRLTHADTLANGAKWGFFIGCGLGLFGGIALAAETDTNATIPLFVVVYGALGAGVGVGVDAAVQSTDVIFSQPARTGASLSVSPVGGRRARGVRLAIRF